MPANSPLKSMRDIAALCNEHESTDPVLDRLEVTREELVEAVAERLLDLIPRTRWIDPWQRLATVWIDGWLMGAMHRAAAENEPAQGGTE